MPFSLDDYINGKKKKEEEQTGKQANYFQFGQQPKAATSPTATPKTAPPTGSAAGGGSGFSLDDFIITKSIRTGQLQQQDHDFNSWLEDVQSFSKRMSSDYTRRQGAYQAPDTFRTYQDKTDSEISDLLKRAYTAQNYYTKYGQAYDEARGAGSSAKLLDGVTQNIDYLKAVRKGSQDEGKWWEQFKDQDTYDTYQRYKGYEAIPQAADFLQKSRYVQDFDESRIARNPFTQEYFDTGHKDLTYAVLNKDPDAVSRSAIANYKHYNDLDDDTLKVFNYIYSTKGADAAYKYLDDMAVGERFSGIEAMALGAYQGTGLASLSALLGKGISSLTGDEEIAKRNEEWYGDLLRDVSQAQEQHPVAYGAGAVGGNLALLYGTGAALGAAEGALATGITIGGKTVAMQMAPVVQGVVNSSLSFLAADAVRNAGAVATGYMEPVDYLKSAGISGVQGLAGGLAGGLVGSGMAKVLQESGMMTPFMEFIRQSATGFASAGANIGTGYLLSEEKPSNEQIATDLATAFLFSVIQGGISTYKATQATKVQMENALNQIMERYWQMGQEWQFMTPEARAEAAGYIMEQTESLRRSLNSTYLAGQQATVDRLNRALDALTQGMQMYANGFPNNMLWYETTVHIDSGLALPSPSGGGGELAEVQAQLQDALAQGIGQAQGATPAGTMPAGAVGALSGDTGISPLDIAIQTIASGGAVSNSMAEAILASPEAMAALEQTAQLAVSPDSPIKDQRNAVKAAVGSLASPDAGLSASGMANDTPAPPTGVTQPQKQNQPSIQRTEAIMLRDQKKVEQLAAVLGKAGGSVLTQMYDPTMAAETYLPAMSAYYNAGKTGGDMAQVYQKVGDAITPQQAQAAYTAGQADGANGGTVDTGITGGYNKSIQPEEVQGYGPAKTEEVHLRGSGQRTDGTHPAGQVPSVEGGAGQDQSGHLTGRPADGGAAALSYGGQVTTASLGIGGGSSSDGIRLVTGGETKATKQAKALAKDRGLRVVLFGGGNLSINVDGELASVRGYISGDRAFIRADHPEYTAEQIMRHEAGHDMIAKGEIDPDTVRERVRRELGGDKTEQLAGLYEAAYRSTALNPEEIWEEVICDSLGDMNIFSGTRLEAAAKELLEPTKKAAGAERSVPRTRGPPATKEGKLSIEFDKNNRPYVIIEEDILSGVPQKNWVKTVKDNLREKFPEGVTVGRNVIAIDKQSRREMTFSKYMQRLFNTEPKLYADKLRATNNADEILLAAQNWVNEALLHPRKDDIIDFSRGEVLLRIGGNDYTAEVIVGSRGESGLLLYDIINLATTTIQGAKNMTGAEYTGIAQKERHGRGPAPVKDSIGQSEGEVKPKFSMETPIEETKNLVALHNLTPQNLEGALDLGGLPMPSIAIVKAETGHSNYGPISLVFDKSTIDPQADSRNKVYGGDAWTPTAPRTEWEVHSDVLRRFEAEINALAGRFAGGMFADSSVLRSMNIDDATAMSLDEISERLANKDAVRAAYLADQGKTLEPVKKTKEWSHKFGNDTLRAFLDKLGVQEVAAIHAERMAGGSIDRLLERAKPAMLEAVAESYTPYSFNKPMTDEMRQIRKQRYAEKQLESPFAVEDALDAAWKMYQDGGATKGENDRLATQEALSEAADEKDVAEWVKPRLEGLLGERGIYNGEDPVTPSGDAKSFRQLHYAYTLENIVQAMAEQQEERGEGAVGVTPTVLQANAAKDYSSISEIKRDSGRLGSVESSEYDDAVAAASEQLDAVIEKVRSTNKEKSANSFINSDYIAQCIMDAARGEKTIDSIMGTFSDMGYKISTQTASDIQALYRAAAALPTEYFEAKPRRAVGFDEVLAAIVPNDIKAELVDRLEEAGVTVMEYRAGDEADRIEKVNSVEWARFSQELESIESLRRENREMKERLEEFRGIAKSAERSDAQAAYWKGQTKRTTPDTLTVRQSDVSKLAKDLTKGWECTIRPKEITQDLTELGEYLLRGEKGTGDIDTHKVWEMAHAIGKQLVESSEAQVNDLYKEYVELRSYVRDTPFTVSETDSHDIADYGDFRKRNFGRMTLKKGATSDVDRIYKEMSEMWPEFFNDKRENAAGDMLLKIEEVLNQLTPVYDNPYSYDMADAIQAATNAVLDGIMGESVRQQAPTFADRQARKLEEAIAKGKQAVAREREKRNAQVQRVKDHYTDMRQRQAERHADSKARSRLLSIAKRLNNKKLPAANRALLDQYIGELDLTAKSMTGSTLAKLTDLRDWYNGITTEGSDTYDPDFIPDEATKRKLERLSKRQINDLTAQEVSDLTEALLNIENELRTFKKLIDSQDRRDVYRMGTEIIRDLDSTKGSKTSGLGGAIDKFIVTETLSPVRQVRRMIGYVDDDPLLRLTESLSDGQRTMLDYQMRAEKPFEKYASDDTFSKNFSGRQAEGIKVVGMTKDGPVEVTVTPAMRASLYLHSLNDQNLRHIKEGGITVPDEKLYRAGKLAEAYARGKTVKLTPSQVRSICAGMTAQEKAYALEAERYFNNTSPEAINAVSEKLKGYSLAQVEHYFPINTDTSFTKSDFETIKKDGSIEGMGWTKERINAATPILLRDLDAVLTQSIQQHAKYVGLAIPVRNFNKVWGVTTASYNAAGSRSSYDASVQSAVKRAWGETGYRYIEKMMTDIQGSTKAKSEWGKAFAKLGSNYAGATLTLNLGVAMKQAASYPTAAAVLGWKPLMRAMKDTGKVNLDLIAKYTPLQWYRSKGYSTKELGDINASDNSRFKALDWMRGKDLPAFLNWIQGMDLITTRKLWKASEYYIQDARRDLKTGTDDYYKAVAEVYNRVIEETQPNYTTMQRPQLLRSDDNLVRMGLGMFKTQVLQNFNILYDAGNNWVAKARHAKTGGAAEQEKAQEAKRDFGRAASALIIAQAIVSAVTIGWAIIRGKDKKYEDEETGEIKGSLLMRGMAEGMVTGTMSMVPLATELYDAGALLTNQFLDGYGLDISAKTSTYYGMEINAVEAFNGTIQSLGAFMKTIGKQAGAVAGGEEIDWNKVRISVGNVSADTGKALGVPADNVLQLITTSARLAFIKALGKYQGEYAALKMTTDPETHKADYYDLLYHALQGDRAAYEAIYADMVGSGAFSEKNVKNAMEKRMKDAQGVTKASELERRYLAPGQDVFYDEVMGEFTGSDVWRSASQEQQDKLEDTLYDLTAGNKNVAKLQEKIDAGAAYGIDEADYLLFRLALSVVDQPTKTGKMGSYTNEEVEEAIGMLTGLSDEARSFLWTSQGKSDKSNPWD